MKKIVAICIVLLSMAGPSSAGSITFKYSGYLTEYAPEGEPPWLTATFTDYTLGGVNGVLLDLTAVNLVATEFLSFWGFNIDPTLTYTTVPARVSGQPAESVLVGENVRSLDGGGKYDVVFAFGSDNFTDGSTASYFFPVLTADDFFFESENSQSSLYTLAHVQGISDDRSAWVGDAWLDSELTPVPEPLSALLVGAGLTLASMLHRRRRRQT